MEKSAIVTGANGFVGKNISKFLLQNGFSVTGIVRKGRVNFGRTIISRDLLEHGLERKIQGSDVLLHLIGRGKQTVESDYEKVNVDLTKNVILLCKKAKIKKIIYISGLGVDKRTTLGYFISKYKAEQEIIHSGLDYTIFRASYIIGKDDPLSTNLRQQMKKGEILIPGSGNYRFQPIFVEDVARIIMKSITDSKFSNKLLDLVGSQIVTFNDFVRDLICGKKIRIKKLDFERAFHDALHNKGNFGVDDLSIMIGDYIGDHHKLKSFTKIKFTKYNEILKPGSLS
jgi:NADH dehydrogenase